MILDRLPDDGFSLRYLQMHVKSVEPNPAVAMIDELCSTISAKAEMRSSDESTFGS